MMKNTRVRLARRPEGLPGPETWTIDTEEVAEPGDGEFLAEVRYISLDPAMRGWIKEGRSYIEPVEVGAVMRAGGVGQVVKSRHPDFAEGDHVVGITGAQSHWLSNGKGARKIDPGAVPLPKYLGVLGMPGMTRGRVPGRPDREAQGLPHGRHRRRPPEVRHADRRIRL